MLVIGCGCYFETRILLRRFIMVVVLSSGRPLPVAKYVLVTPKMAAAWLKFNTNNRKIAPLHESSLRRDLRNNRFLVTHQGIAFDWNGVLVDGQHRLEMIVAERKPVYLLVVRGVDPETREVIDCGKVRSLADSLSISDGDEAPDKNELAVLKRLLCGMGKVPRLTVFEAKAAWKMHCSVIQFACQAMPKSRALNGIVNASVLAPVARAAYTSDLDRLRSFCTMLSLGIFHGDGYQIVILLRNYLLQKRGSSSVEQQERYAKTERALVAFLNRENIGRLVAVKDEQFPIPEEAGL